MRVRAGGSIFDAAEAPMNCRSCAFTSVARLTDGTLLVAFRNATGRDTPDGRLRIMGSRDVGRTWETIVPGMTAAIDGIDGNLYAGYFTELEPGRLMGAFVWVDRSDPQRSLVNPDTAGVLPMRALTAESTDGGATWNAFRAVDLSPHVGCSVTGPIMRLRGDVLALPYERWKEYDDPRPGEHGAQLRLSGDGGLTWSETVTVASDPDAHVFYWDQRIAAHPDTGQLVGMFWTHDRRIEQDIENHIAWGTPDGLSWMPPRPTGWRGQHCEPIAAGGDRLVALYVHRHDPPSLRAILSEDFGQTWQTDTEIVFYTSPIGAELGTAGARVFEEFWQDMMAWRFGHPRGVLLPDGSLFVAYYAGDEHATSMRWSHIEL